MNVVCLVGRLTADPELKETPSGVSVNSFSIAVNSSSKNADGTHKADFINCVAWRSTAEFITKYFSKGQMIGISGSIQTRQYTDRETGKNRTAFEVVATNTFFVESKNKASEPRIGSSLDDFSKIASDDGDLPF